METKIQENQVGVLRNQIECSDRVVHTTLMQDAGGKINLVAMRRGQALSQHVAPMDVMVTVIDGSLDFIINGQSNVLRSGEFVFMAKDTPHAVNAVEDTKFMLTFLRGE